MAGSPKPDSQIQGLVDLISNTLDAFTTVLFLAPGEGQPLSIHAYQSLSQNLDLAVSIGPGEGLIGWVHKNNQPVSVDQFERDTRRLLFYRTDESIKSFLAIPLARARGVLAVDSKQRYVFTDKSQKILHQFGQAIETALENLGKATSGAALVEAMRFSFELDQVLNRRLEPDEAIPLVLALIRRHSGAAACFLTAILPAEPDHYLLLGQDSPLNVRLGRQDLFLESGLAGWVMQKGQTLILDKNRPGQEKAFIFSPDEPLKRFAGFAGFPIIWAGRTRGALLLAAEQVFVLDEAARKSLESAAVRLAAGLEIERLYERVTELGRLDPQVGLPHRTYFTKRLARLLKMASVKGSTVLLLALELAGLERVAREASQDAALEALRTAARFLLQTCRPETELGHLSHGLFAAAFFEETEAGVLKLVENLAAEMADRPLHATPGRVNIEVRWAMSAYPAEARRAENLIQLCLQKLIQPPGPFSGE
ncbi:MAG: GAF domain-containing protein [Thermodesulfobacteriota bacterium]